MTPTNAIPVTIGSRASGPNTGGIAITSANPPTVSTDLVNASELKKIYQRQGTAIYRSRYKLPDERLLTLFIAETAPEATEKIRLNLLKKLNELHRAQAKDGLILAVGDFGFSAENRPDNFYGENWLTPQWLVSHRWAKWSVTKDWPLAPAILLSKDFFDGINGWRAIPASLRFFDGNLAIDLIPVN